MLTAKDRCRNDRACELSNAMDAEIQGAPEFPSYYLRIQKYDRFPRINFFLRDHIRVVTPLELSDV